MGALFNAGWTLDAVLDMSWDQLQIVSSCVTAYKGKQLNILVDIASSALGGGKKKKKQSRKNKKKASLDEKLAFLGVDVTDA